MVHSVEGTFEVRVCSVYGLFVGLGILIVVNVCGKGVIYLTSGVDGGRVGWKLICIGRCTQLQFGFFCQQGIGTYICRERMDAKEMA